MSVDFPRAWEIAQAADSDRHHEKCSYRIENGALLCDCHALHNHPEFLSSKLYTKGGEIYRRE